LTYRGAGMQMKTASLVALTLSLSCAGAVSQPVINSIYPPTLTQRAGDHLAFVASATGSGTLTYQWSFAPASQPSVILTGQTSSTLTVTNIQTTNSGAYWVTVNDSSGIPASNSVTLNVSTNLLRLFATNLVMARIGDGGQLLSHATGNTLYLDQYATNGAYISTIMVPD